MEQKTTNQKQSLKLPERLVTFVELSRTKRELGMLDDWFTQTKLRVSGQEVTPPKTSVTLEELASVNGVSLLDDNQRRQLLSALEAFSEHAPKIHVSFAVEPSARFLHRLVLWLREKINPNVLLEVGLQPTITAGCNVRTTNKVFDMSLRHRFSDSRDLLYESIIGVEDKASVNTTATASEAQPSHQAQANQAPKSSESPKPAQPQQPQQVPKPVEAKQ